MNIYFVSGHLNITKEEFELHYALRLEAALEEGASFVIGDARGADSLSQMYLLGKRHRLPYVRKTQEQCRIQDGRWFPIRRRKGHCNDPRFYA